MSDSLDHGFDEWMARELPRATGYEIDLCRTVWRAALSSAYSQSQADTLLPDDFLEELSDYCECGAVHTGLEDGGRCEACGKII